MKIKFILPKLTVILVLIIAFASCQDDFSTIGTEILNGQSQDIKYDESSTVVAFSQKLQPVQTNGLPLNQLGIYNDPVYGKSTVNLLSQITLSVPEPEFGENPVLDSVKLYIPFFSTGTTVDEETTFVLDSIFGDSPITISMYESNYFLRELDPTSNFEESQQYFSNQGGTFSSFQGELIGEIVDFEASDEGFVINEGEDDEETLDPGIRVELPIEFFMEKIIDKEGSEELISNNNFKNYFRGIYFKVSSATDDGTFVLFNISQGNITLNYSYDSTADEGEREVDTFQLLFNGINVNVFTNELPGEIKMELNNPDTINGSERLFVRGGDGIVSVINLFGDDIDENGVADELELLREKKWLINEANLIFYVRNNDIEGGATEPERLVIYNTETGEPLIDYLLDSTLADEVVDAFTTHLGRLERDSDDNGEFYKIRLTNHLSNVINKDSTNVPLAITVSQNVTLAAFQDVAVNTPTSPFVGLSYPQPVKIDAVPASSVISPEGTILHGSASQSENKRLKLQIYYTEPN